MNAFTSAADSTAATQRRYLFLTVAQWRTGVGISTVAGALAATASLSISIWISVTVFLAALTIYHMAFASRYIVPLPHVAILVSALQYVLAAWAGTFFVVSSSNPDAINLLPYYLTYAGPVMVSFAAGWALALIGFRNRRPSRALESPGLQAELDFLFALGLCAAVLGRVVPNQGNLSFVVLLVASLRYIGVFGRMIINAPGWKWRLAVVLVAEIVFAVSAAMFHPLLLWGMWTLGVYLYCFRPSRRGILIGLVAAALVLPALQEAKWRLRGNLEEEISSGDDQEFEMSLSKSVTWLQLLAKGFWHSLTLQLSPEFLSDTANRYNQGWIVTRVMFFVPVLEPYAEGETLREAIVAAVLPRIAAPDKRQAGGHELMLRYAGIDLGENTSMDLGYAGEMYVNFGPTGGVVACGLYSFAIGLCFRLVCRRAFSHSMWWSVAPFIFFPVVKAEDDIGFVLNWAVKGFFVLFVVVLLLPNLRRALFARGCAALPSADPSDQLNAGLPSR